jgi:FKBP-type peptidyl-prolyl cis-trans isomerase
MRRLSLLLPVLALLAACGGGGGANPGGPSTVPPQPFSATDLRVGTGAEAVNGTRVTVHYSGWLYSTTAAENKGTLFDSSIGRTPYSFTLGSGQVIRGWDQGVLGMKVGGVRRLVIPPDLAYGASGNGQIPPNATLVFEVELLSVQ